MQEENQDYSPKDPNVESSEPIRKEASVQPGNQAPDEEAKAEAAGLSTTVSPQKPVPQRGMGTGVWLSLLCLSVAIAVLLTFALTTISNQDHYSQLLREKELELNNLKLQLEAGTSPTDPAFEKLETLQDLFEQYAYYYGKVSDEELMDAVMKAYVEATGDLYAEYYTVEEYEAITSDRLGSAVGVGVSIVQTVLEVNGMEYQGFQIIAIFEDAPAQDSDLRVGDFIYRVKVNGEYKSVSELGYTEAANAVRGEEGTLAELSAFRKTSAGYTSIDVSIVRGKYEKQSVSYRVSETDPTVGIVRISEFDLTTPTQFKHAIKALQASGVEQFVFDVRNNPGGDLQSIKAVLTYFLQPGDLILSAIKRDGTVETSYVAEVIKWGGDYAACNVTAEEIGMFADLDMVVLCNENTASAAEVFTATLRDYDLATIVGAKTFGKGIMQTTITITKSRVPVGYVKMTTHAYVTKCGVTYHEIGISPDEGYAVALSEEALEYHFYLLPEEMDDQLLMAIQAVKS